MDKTIAVNTIESVEGFTDESSDIGKAWIEVKKIIEAKDRTVFLQDHVYKNLERAVTNLSGYTLTTEEKSIVNSYLADIAKYTQ